MSLRSPISPEPRQPCPCYSGQPYHGCCGPLHKGKSASTALQLLRARFAAYALGNCSYIMRTTHPQSPHRQRDKHAWRSELDQFCQLTRFLGLLIVAKSHPSPQETTVTFHALLQQQGRDASFTERSLFRKVNDDWLYVDAVHPQQTGGK